jgi:hypothetical protein
MSQQSPAREKDPEIERLERRVAEPEAVESDLAASRAMLQATVESLPFECFVIGEDGRYLVQNAIVKANWGDLVGRRPEEIASDQKTLAIWLDNNRRALAGEKIEEEIEHDECAGALTPAGRHV